MFTSNFTSKEIVTLYDNYFIVSAWERTYFEIISKNTGHYWIIIKPDEQQDREMQIETLHKYQKNGYYHHQCYSKSINSAVKKIKSHDSYYINKKRLLK